MLQHEVLSQSTVQKVYYRVYLRVVTYVVFTFKMPILFEILFELYYYNDHLFAGLYCVLNVLTQMHQFLKFSFSGLHSLHKCACVCTVCKEILIEKFDESI